MTGGFRHLIKIEGKNFFNLSRSEAADMIDAYLAGGDDRYEDSALPEFMIVPNPTGWLEELRLQLARIDAGRRTEEENDGLATRAGRKDLAELSHALRATK
jgi:hypothetical protein